MHKKVFHYLFTSSLVFLLFLFTVCGGPVYGQSTVKLTEMKLLPFKLNEVTLQKSIFTFNREKTIAYLKLLDADRLLHNFRVAAGVPSKAKSCGGWEKPDCKLRGHSLGHFMVALAQAYASSADLSLKEKLDYIVMQLATCQAKLSEKGNPNGFLSAYSIEQFNRLEKFYHSKLSRSKSLILADSVGLAGKKLTLWFKSKGFENIALISIRITEWIQQDFPVKNDPNYKLRV